jgi:hypothetical protein
MIIGMERAQPLESYCDQCDTWSSDDEWEDHVEYDSTENVTVDCVVCPSCGHWHPPYDPAIREAAA